MAPSPHVVAPKDDPLQLHLERCHRAFRIFKPKLASICFILQVNRKTSRNQRLLFPFTPKDALNKSLPVTFPESFKPWSSHHANLRSSQLRRYAAVSLLKFHEATRFSSDDPGNSCNSKEHSEPDIQVGVPQPVDSILAKVPIGIESAQKHA